MSLNRQLSVVYLDKNIITFGFVGVCFWHALPPRARNVKTHTHTLGTHRTILLSLLFVVLIFVPFSTL